MAVRVAAIVVTYNRKDLLALCLKGVQEQTRPLDAIYIIDNNSTDGTKDLLVGKGFLAGPDAIRHQIRSISCPARLIDVEYSAMPSNRGPAAGYALGMRRAFEEGFDWIWTMDDDVVPLPGALETLLSYQQKAKCILGERQNPDGSLFRWQSGIDLTTFRTFYYSPQAEQAPERHPDGTCWEGMILHRDVIARVGFPDEAFFIGFDDTEYGLRISAVEKILHIREITLRRLIEQNGSERSIFGLGFGARPRESAWKTYYSVRNLFLLRSRYPRGTYQLLFLWLKVIKKMISPFIYLDDDIFLRMRLAMKGVSDGLAPEDENSETQRRAN
jgi:rhamnopyranosyl-N-acetylglucosaminyl-diphospho-decaprenol beta-1,3/1,4-galactofuranosyltransferase